MNEDFILNFSSAGQVPDWEVTVDCVESHGIKPCDRYFAKGV